MGRRLSLAKQYIEKIKHLYDHAGPAGYDQALYSHSKISEYRSKSGERSSDSQEIKEIARRANEMMAEMKKWRDEFRAAADKGPAKIPMKKVLFSSQGKCGIQLDDICIAELQGPIQEFVNKDTEEHIYACFRCSDELFRTEKWVEYKFKINE